MKFDFLIIGQGLAGTVLAHQLLERGKTVKLINLQNRPSSSKVAGGMYNPVTGKHLAKTWLADELFEMLEPYYHQLEQLLQTKLCYPFPIYRPYKNESQKAQFQSAIDKHDLAEFCRDSPPLPALSENINQELGGILTLKSGRIDVPELINKFAAYLNERDLLLDEEFEYELLSFKGEDVIYKDLEADKAIFCEGFYVKDNPYFNWLPFNPVKGETLEVSCQNLGSEMAINQGSWIMPMGGQYFKVGATYSWHELDFQITEEAREKLIKQIAQFLRLPYEVLHQSAGVRPATTDRRPIIGMHPAHKNLYIFNGLGTKGVSLAPYVCQNFVNHLLDQKELLPETTIERFYALYS